MDKEGVNYKDSHQIVTRPHRPIRYLDSEGTPLNPASSIEIEIKKADIIDKIDDFLIDKKATPSFLAKELMDCYNEKFENSIKKPDLFLHLTQKENLESLAPRVQIYVSDMVLGNLNNEGFYRTIIDGESIDYKKTKKYISEILRLYRAGVMDIKGAYFGYRINP